MNKIKPKDQLFPYTKEILFLWDEISFPYSRRSTTNGTFVLLHLNKFIMCQKYQ